MKIKRIGTRLRSALGNEEIDEEELQEKINKYVETSNDLAIESSKFLVLNTI